MENILTYMTFIPVAGMFVVMAIPRDRHNLIRQVSLAATIPPLLMAIWLYSNFDRTTTEFQYVVESAWMPAFNIQYILGIDGLSVTMVLLTALLCPICLLSSWNIEKGVKGYHMLFLLLDAAMMGVFCALDFFLFFIFWEVMLLPMYFLIGIWGGPRREYAAIKFFLYTQLGGVLMLISMLALYFYNDPHTFDMRVLMANAGTYTRGFQFIVWIALFIGFAIKIPAFPFHTWLPDAHVEAPTAISVILAGVLLKMGTYGILRINYPMLPIGTQECAFWALAVLGTWNIVYGALCAMAQEDMKKLVAYSSISHMGYVMLGMATLTPQGINGAVLQMFNHGTITAMLFLLVGVVYDRAHHRRIDGFGGLASVMPTYTGIMSIAFFAALGLPGLSAFISEALVFLGAWQYDHVLTIIAATSVVLTAGYMLWLLQRVWLGPVNEKYADMPDVTTREVVTLIPLAIIVLILGVQPHYVLDLINPTLLAINDTVAAANAVAQATVLP
jgi:NADH-quinone oxidoreductase subunit M